MGNVPTNRTQVFYNYDKAVVDYCHDHIKQLNYSTGARNVIPCVFATPQRAFAQVARQLARKRGATQAADADIKNVPLPFMSLSRVDEKYDPTRYVRYTWANAQYVPSTEKYYSAKSPAPYDFTYQLEVWSRTIDEMDDASNQIRQTLRADEIWLTVNHPQPYDDLRVLALFQGQIEHSEVDPRNKDERVVRRSYTFLVKGWVCYEMTVSSVIERAIVDFYDDATPPEHLDQIVITEQAVDSAGIVLPVTPDNEEYMSTTMFCGLIVGEAQVGAQVGTLTAPAAMRVVGMQAHVGGRVPTGAPLVLQLVVNGTLMPTYSVTIADGASRGASIFASPVAVTAGAVISAQCASVGSGDPGDWIEVQLNANVDITR